ncbi:MAG: hypothetical protein HC904_09460 [Blastochloris sp.]|nr:hypothetical protein [Blastochloris sp.]
MSENSQVSGNSIWFKATLTVLLVVAALPLQAEVVLYFRDGSKMVCEEAIFEGEFVRVKVKQGEMRVPVANLDEKTFRKMVAEENPKPASQPNPTQSTNPPQQTEPTGLPSAQVEAAAVKEETTAAAPTDKSGPPAGWSPVPPSELKPELPDADPDITVVDEELQLTGEPRSGAGGKKVTVYYRIALKADKTPGPRAGQLVFYAPYINDKTWAREWRTGP